MFWRAVEVRRRDVVVRRAAIVVEGKSVCRDQTITKQDPMEVTGVKADVWLW